MRFYVLLRAKHQMNSRDRIRCFHACSYRVG